MKKLITILFLLIVCAVHAQYHPANSVRIGVGGINQRVGDVGGTKASCFEGTDTCVFDSAVYFNNMAGHGNVTLGLNNAGKVVFAPGGSGNVTATGGHKYWVPYFLDPITISADTDFYYDPILNDFNIRYAAGSGGTIFEVRQGDGGAGGFNSIIRLNTDTIQATNLIGLGINMVTVNSQGYFGSQAIPSGTGTETRDSIGNCLPLFSSTTTTPTTTPNTQFALVADLAGTVYANNSTSTSVPAFTAQPIFGRVGSTGTMGLRGTTSGTITIQPQSVAGTYNFNLPNGAGSVGQLLQSGGGSSSAMTWTTPTYPSASGTAGKIIRSDGTNNVYSTSTFADTYAASVLLYANGANTVAGLATANGGILNTSSSGVPVITVTPLLGVAGTSTGTIRLSGATSGVVTIQPQSAAGTYNFNLPNGAGSVGQLLQSGGGSSSAMTWTTPTYPSASGTAGKIIRSDGTNNVYSTSTFADTYAASVLLYANGANTVAGLATANGGILNTSSSGVPVITVTPLLGVAGTSTGTIRLSGATSGVVTIQPQSAAGTYNFNLPTTAGTAGQYLTSQGGGGTANTWTTPVATVDTLSIEYVIDGGGATITSGSKGYVEIPFNCTILRATLLADQSGSIVVDVFKCTYAQFDAGATHPVAADKITASAPPTISAATKSQDATLTGWTTAIASGSILAFNVNSITTCQRVTLSLKVIR